MEEGCGLYCIRRNKTGAVQQRPSHAIRIYTVRVERGLSYKVMSVSLDDVQELRHGPMDVRVDARPSNCTPLCFL